MQGGGIVFAEITDTGLAGDHRLPLHEILKYIFRTDV